MFCFIFPLRPDEVMKGWVCESSQLQVPIRTKNLPIKKKIKTGKKCVTGSANRTGRLVPDFEKMFGS